MSTETKSFQSEAQRIIDIAIKAAQDHSPNLDSQNAFLSGYLMSELRAAYHIIENARDELKIVQQQLNSIGEL